MLYIEFQKTYTKRYLWHNLYLGDLHERKILSNFMKRYFLICSNFELENFNFDD